MSSSQCRFRAHNLLPDKCANCFGDKKQHADHQATSDAAGNTNGNSELSRDQLQSEVRKAQSQKGVSCEPVQADDKKCCCQKYELEIKRLQVELEEARSGADSAELERVREELRLAKKRLETAENDRDKAKEELKALEKEMEEMHDNFKEEESDQFEQLKQELDLAMKNCKILQIRLNKSERQYHQLEQVKAILEQQLEESSSGQSQHESKGGESSRLANLQIGQDFVKLPLAEYDQLLRDLNDTIEREKDLQEQIKYSQEEAQLKSDRLQAIESENEVLLNKINKLTLSNSKLRSGARNSQDRVDSEAKSPTADQDETRASVELMQQNEQLNLALELAHSELNRLSNKLQETSAMIESREGKVRELEEELKKSRDAQREQTRANCSSAKQEDSNEIRRLENELRELRLKLVHSERQCKQLQAQLELNQLDKQQNSANYSHQTMAENVKDASMQQVNEQCTKLKAENAVLEQRIVRLSAAATQNVSQTPLESDLLMKLKKQLDASESELAKARSRLVELDVESSRFQRQYKRLCESIKSNESITRKVHLPAEPLRESMSRQELRQALKSLEEELDEVSKLAASKDSLIKELSGGSGEEGSGRSSPNSEQQVKSLHRLMDQERLLSSNLKVDVARLEQTNSELILHQKMLERERAVMDEELDKLRQVNGELNSSLASLEEESERLRAANADLGSSLEESRKNERNLSVHLRELQVMCEGLRAQLVADQSSGSFDSRTAQIGRQMNGGNGSDLLLLNRDLSELRVKNGFLMRQLEIAREDGARQLEDLRQSAEAQRQRAVEMAQLELKEQQLVESQQLRDELNELKQKLAQLQRQLKQAEEETSQERDRLRSLDRDWRREKSQWQQRVEKLDAQLAIERRSSEYKLKECESSLRDKERHLLAMQDSYVQLERDQKRLQNKYQLLEENGESRQKSLMRELEQKKRELSELISNKQMREEEYYENCKRFNNEKSTLMDALESIRRSYDEKLAEVKSVRELIQLRQDQSFKERCAAQEKVDKLEDQIIRLGEFESQSRLLRQQLEQQDKQLDAMRREIGQLKEERQRGKQRCDELERRCIRYERQEFIAKTGSISNSSTASAFLRAKNALIHSPSSKVKSANDNSKLGPTRDDEQLTGSEQNLMTEKLSSKINDQRHLINMLKQQVNELQMEVKQAKLMQTSERSKWQTRMAQLSGQLNEAQEKLLFECSFVSHEMFENARHKAELKWTNERHSNLDMIQQLQQQNELLIRDLKKLSQSRDLLRLQNKQLEEHNNKLSRKLIEYQQQAEGFKHIRGVSAELDTLRAQRDRLEARQTQLEQINTQLLDVLRDEAKPLAEKLAKIFSSSELSKSSKKREESSADESNKSSLNSSHRPLTISATKAQEEKSGPSTLNISTALPAKQARLESQSRLSRLFSGEPKQSKSADAADKSKADTTGGGNEKSVRKVKVKSANSLVVGSAEKRQLKQNLDKLMARLDQVAQLSCTVEEAVEQRERRAVSETTPHTPTEAGLPDWDLDSERSWSIGPSAERRSKPLAGSLTDYESEVSLACSDFSSYSSGNLRARSNHQLGSGADSDSCLQQSTRRESRKRSSGGLKSRLSNTLRSISRSITAGLASDSETDLNASKSSRSRRATSKEPAGSDSEFSEIRV